MEWGILVKRDFANLIKKCEFNINIRIGIYMFMHVTNVYPP